MATTAPTPRVTGPSTTPAPVVHAVHPTFAWLRPTVPGKVQSTRLTTGLRIHLLGHWAAAGEQLGVVVAASDDAGRRAATEGGPLADLVSRVVGDGAPDVPLTAAWFGASEDVPGPRPAPTRHAATLVEHDAAGEGVVVVGHPVRFDAARNRSYVDVGLHVVGVPPAPSLRLALVRLRPDAPAGRRLSPVTIADPVRIPPNRTVHASRVGTAGVRVKVFGAALDSSFTVTQRRVAPRAAPLGDATVAAAPADGWTVTAEPPTAFDELVRLVLDWSGPGPLDPALAAELRAGHVIVEERDVGGDADAAAAMVFSEVIERAVLGIEA